MLICIHSNVFFSIMFLSIQNFSVACCKYFSSLLHYVYYTSTHKPTCTHARARTDKLITISALSYYIVDADNNS